MPRLIDFAQSKQYRLSIRLCADGFSFCISHLTIGEADVYYRRFKVNPLHSMAANVKEFLQQTSELHHVFGRVEVLVKTDRYTTLPLEWYEDDRVEALFYANLPRENNENVLTNILHRTNIVVLFSLDKLAHLYLSEQFPGATFYASVCPQIEYLCPLHRGETTQSLYVHVERNEIEVYCIRAGKVQLLNTYKAQTREDRIYYITHLWQSRKMKQDADKLHLAGNAPLCDELEEYFRPALPNVLRATVPDELQLQDTAVIEALPFDLQTLLACE